MVVCYNVDTIKHNPDSIQEVGLMVTKYYLYKAVQHRVVVENGQVTLPNLWSLVQRNTLTGQTLRQSCLKQYAEYRRSCK